MPNPPPADVEDIVRVLGDIREHRVASILEVGPTVAELIEARERVEQDDGVPYRLGPPGPRVAQLMLVIRELADDEDEEDEGLVAEPSFVE